MANKKTFYRYVSREELEDWQEAGRLTAGRNTLDQKFLTDSPEHALEWWRLFDRKGWYSTGEGGAILEIRVAEEKVEKFVYHGDNHDGVGPAWTARPELLDGADIRIEREWENNENPT